MKLLILALLSLHVVVNEAKRFEKCELARLLKQHGMDGYYGYSLGNYKAKIFERCELARALKKGGLDQYYGYSLGNIFLLSCNFMAGLKLGICMAYYESRFSTAAVGPRNSNGSRDYGIFQINSRWWCTNGEGRSANGCSSSCSSFTNDDIINDIVCAKRIVRDPNRMNAWVAWRKFCKGKNLSSWTRGCGV